MSGFFLGKMCEFFGGLGIFGRGSYVYYIASIYNLTETIGNRHN